jgi:hypothetical protein
MCAVHAALALAMMRWSAVATVHAWMTLAAGIYLALSSPRPIQLAYFGGYVLGAEVLWRMADARVFWEMGKYTLIAALGVAILRHPPRRSSAFPLSFALAFVPACLLTLDRLPLAEAREQISFNLSGPIALAVSAAFFLRLRLSSSDVRTILQSFLVPVIGIWTVIVTSIATADELVFTNESNSSLSGGYGPNQVSTVLGFAALAALSMAVFLLSRHQLLARAGFFALSLLLGMQSALTFSRSGLYLCVLSLAVASLLSLRNRDTRRVLATSALAVYVLARVVILPQLNTFTGGTLSARFAQAGTTGRDEIMKADLRIWMAHPIFGVGPGMAVFERELLNKVAAHSEVTRALAEHGVLGLLAMGYLAIEISQRIFGIGSERLRFVAAAFVAFGLLLMVSNAMRIALSSYTVAFVFGTFADETKRRTTRRKLPVVLRHRIAQPL